MNKVKYRDIQQAITVAVTDKRVADALAKREQDDLLDCVEIKCRVDSAVGADAKVFKLVFNYHNINDDPERHEDLYVEVKLSAKESVVLIIRSQ